MVQATIYNNRVTKRGNEGMKLITVYVEPELLKKFKAICALEGKSMTVVLNEAIKKHVKDKQK